ncbi:MAG: TetR/AcrR family transcriptional regulator [Smithellaceae bacterium]|nr:TetR/AcrR family transcriptional regulator [Smithellaceae bacterium]
MANKARSAEVIDLEKQRMSMVALEMISKNGYNNLSIRKLSKKLDVSPSTIYNYFTDSEEIYIYVLNKGYERLFNELKKACDSHTDAVEKLRTLCRTFFSFSVRERNLVLIMFILDVPRYHDYEGSKHESLKDSLANALKCRDLVARIMIDMAHQYPSFSKKDVERCTFRVICQLIGLFTMYDNQIMRNISTNVEASAELLLGEIVRPFEEIRAVDAKKLDIACGVS